LENIGILSIDSKIRRNNPGVGIVIEPIIQALALSMDVFAVAGGRCAHFDWL
jgi:hypothetical protein